MEMKKKSREPDTNDLSLNGKLDEGFTKEGDSSQIQAGVDISAKKPRIGSPSNHNISPITHPNPANMQWSGALQHPNVVLQPQVLAAPSIPVIASPAAIAMQCLPQVGLSPSFPQSQQVQLPPGFIASNVPAFWPLQRPAYAPIPVMGPINNSLQVPSGSGLQVNASGSMGQFPGIYYQFGCPYPAFPAGSRDHSYLWGQVQQPPPPVEPFPGTSHHVPSSGPHQMTGCSGGSQNTSPKGVIRPSAEIAEKHRVLWETQSAENVQLWAVISSLQSELSDVKSRLIKLETEAKSLKTPGEQVNSQDAGRVVVSQLSKRGRPRSIPSVVAMPSPDDLHPRPRGGRRPRLNKGPPEARELNCRKDDKNKEESLEKLPPLVTVLHGDGVKSESLGDPAHQNPNLSNTIHSQSDRVGQDSTSEKKATSDNSTEKVKSGSVKGSSSAYRGVQTDRTYGSTLNIRSISGREIISEISQGSYSNGNLPRQVNSGVLPWNMVNEEENASEDLDEESTESDKHDEDIENVGSMYAQGVVGAKNVDQYNANALKQNGNPSRFPNW